MNPLLKTLLGNLAAVAALTIDSAAGNPTGGLQTFLGAHADVALVYTAVYALVHNYISAKYPPAPKAS